MMRIEKTKKGFTLIELLVVVAIIGILAAIAIPQFAKYRSRAYNSAAQSDLRNVQSSLEGWFADYQEYPQVAQNGAPAATSGVLDLTASTDGNGEAETVTLSAWVGLASTGADDGTDYNVVTKHTNGGTICYGATNTAPTIQTGETGLEGTAGVDACNPAEEEEEP
ncbi:type IV pilin protein [Geovibrio ferrireducens]|uniref:type IV pilin protein n=1 Tax=Geovibrio ferrireducens TaxID=46201 RepID=UPI002AF6C301|nr:prepilin-type N-terminal cleavage/methylation domain-containing protein [Geovibrio ferrireducens]